MKTNLLILAVYLVCQFGGAAAPLTESTFTEVINDVSTLTPDGSATPSKMSVLLKAPDRVRTGSQSRAELMAADKTITRVGANTVFSFADQGRTLNLEKGNLLFHSPKGLGGGTIRSGGAAAAVLGTTLIVSSTIDDGFKVILLEGEGSVTLANGQSAVLHAGQMVYVLPGGTRFSPILDINLAKLVSGSLLINGFSHELSSLPFIFRAIHDQTAQLTSGSLTDTGRPADAYLFPPVPGNGLDAQEHGTYQVAIPAPITPSQIESLYGSGQANSGSPTPGSSGGSGLVPISNYQPGSNQPP